MSVFYGINLPTSEKYKWMTKEQTERLLELQNKGYVIKNGILNDSEILNLRQVSSVDIQNNSRNWSTNLEEGEIVYDSLNWNCQRISDYVCNHIVVFLPSGEILRRWWE